jgi:cell wall-associated NlpC family hydrolase
MARFWIVIAAAALSACASSGATPRPFPVPAESPLPPPVEAPEAPPALPAATGYAIVGTALALRGSPYRNGGTDPSGFDCSGFVQYVFGRHGLAVPRSVGELYQAGQAVTDALEPGDLVFFDTAGGGASHVGIVVGGEEFVHAPSTRGVVRVDRIGGAYWSPRFVGARRIN